MLGQGRPHCRGWPRGRPWSTIGFVGAMASIGLLVGASIFCRASAGADLLDVRVRIAWGGGEARPWRGTIRVTAGALSEVAPLGLEPDAPGSMLLADPSTIQIAGRTPRSYDGCDIRVQAPSDAKLLVQLWAGPAADGPPLEVPLSRIIRDFTQFNLDNKNNRLLAQRSPGDSLRVSFAHPSLVFAPGEKFELEVQPQHLELASNGTYSLAAALGPGRTEEHVWNQDHDVKVDAAGAPQSVSLSIPLPEQEGVYDLRLSLHSKRLSSTLVWAKALATRKIQLVVVSPVKTVTPQPAAWQSVLEFDPASPKWWERMARLPSWTRLPTVPRPVESRPARARTQLGKAWVELSPQAWQAYPLSIGLPGTPHLLEIEYPSDIEQSLGISLIEPNAAGHVGPIGLDSGVDVPRPEPGHKAEIRRHRLVFWPQTRTPYVLLANRRAAAPAVFGKIDVQAGPLSLPPLSIPSASFSTRVLAAYYDKPLFAENFSASEALDPISRRGLDDWITFGAAGQRLVETLLHGGFNALVLTAACEGSAIYPSQLLAPTPKYDSGVFFESGQDAVRKDVLELLFRLCDRSGLTLIPGVQFAGPLPQLEAIRQAGGTEAAGLEPLGSDGLTWLSRSGGPAGGFYYNTLDPRVQQAMTAVVAELAERYGHHASFGGVAVHLSADSYAILPDETCSLDEATFARFLAETKIQPPPAEIASPHARWDFIRRSAGPDWLKWRTERIAELYRGMREEIVQRRAEGKLYLTTANLLAGRQWQSILRPELPPRESVAEVLPLLGLDFERLAGDGIVVPRPQRIVSSAAPELRDQEQYWNRDQGLDKLFARAAGGSSLHFLLPAPQRLPDFDAVSPFGSDKTRTLLISQLAPADAANRERFVTSLAKLDPTLMIDGGWLLPLGQEAALAPLAKVYRRLPAEPFETFARPARPEDSGSSQELIVRTLTKGDKSWFYAVNPAPWPVTAEIQFASAQPLRLLPYNNERPARVQPRAGGATWTVEMEAFDLVGGEVAGASAKIINWEVTPPPDAASALGEQVRDVARRVHHLWQSPHAPALFNPSFEELAADGSAAGWVHAGGTGMLVEVDRTQGFDSQKSLHLARRGGAAPVWVRSSPFTPPTTGRIQMTARLRIADAKMQPQLRLAIEGRLEGQVYYRRVNCGSIERVGDALVPALATDWTMQTIALTDLPLAGLTELRVGFDLMSEGEVWIDDVQVQDLWLQRYEYNELLQGVPTARLQADSGRLNECRLFTEGYWPGFLRQHVQLPDGREQRPLPAAALPPSDPPPVASRPKLPKLPGLTAPASGAQPPARTSERKNWWPAWPWK
jgi:hypothetical protein